MNETYDPANDGWRPVTGAPMPAGLGVPWAKRDGASWLYGLQTTPAHANPAGTVHGGILMTFADHGMSMLAWEASGRVLCTTIQLNTHFLDAIRPGDFVELRAEVTRRTTSMVFIRGLAGVRTADSLRDAGAMDGIWRVLRAR